MREPEWREPTGFVWFAPAGGGNVWVDVNRRIIQNYPHGRGFYVTEFACLVRRLCRLRDSCRFWNVSRRKLLQSDPFVSEQPALPADAAAVSGKTPISADDSVARNHNGNRVCRIGQADRTDGFRAAQLSRQRPIT